MYEINTIENNDVKEILKNTILKKKDFLKEEKNFIRKLRIFFSLWDL